MNIHEEVSNLRKQAIKLLLDEREKIDEELDQLGYEKETAPKRGRPKKTIQEQDPAPLACRSGMSGESGS